MDLLVKEVFKVNASSNTKYHAVHAYVFFGFTLRFLAALFCKSPQTIANWVRKWHITGELKRLSAQKRSRFQKIHQQWIKSYVDKNPLSYLHEIKKEFESHFTGMRISISTIYKILIHELNYTKKTIERRAIDIRFSDICRFTKEVNSIRPVHDRLIFLDEMSLDNRDMLRKKGWFLRNHQPTMFAQFVRKERISILAFIGISGFIDVYETEGTFNRTKFFNSLRDLVQCRKLKTGSVVIMDGAKIHLDPNIVNYLRSVGLYVVFLPSYCPFFNPIEIMFSRVKSQLQRMYKENSSDEKLALLDVIAALSKVDMSPTFISCGYSISGLFDPSIAYDHSNTVSNCENIELEQAIRIDIASNN